MNIKQRPLYKTIPAGSEIIFVVEDTAVVTNYKGKYVADVYISQDAATIGTAALPTTTLKVNPNNHGVGIFDFGNILDNYVHPDYEGGVATFTNISTNKSEFKTNAHSVDFPHAIHTIDEFSSNQNSCRYVLIRFYIEYALSMTDAVEIDISDIKESNKLLIWNGTLDWTDHLWRAKGNYGYPLSRTTDNQQSLLLGGSALGRFMTNCPLKQYVREKDFMTLPFFNNLTTASHSFQTAIASMIVKFYLYSSPSSIFSSASVINNGGAYFGLGLDSNLHIQYYGCGPGNYVNAGFPIPASWDYYTVEARDKTGGIYSAPYEFHKQQEDCKGFETIRLTWLNKWGGWDYYNFTKKSIRATNRKPLHYNQYGGTWNSKEYSIYGWKGGKRVVSGVVSEDITINSDFILESEAKWLEELFVSSDVFILNENEVTDSYGNINDHPYANYTGYHQKYVEPVIVKSTTNIRKTKANDKLIQYSIDLTRSKPKRIHKG